MFRFTFGRHAGLGRILALLLVALFAGTGAAAAQERPGKLLGRFVQPDGVGVPGATISVLSPGGEVNRTVLTDAGGWFAVAGLPPGKYEINADGAIWVGSSGIEISAGAESDVVLHGRYVTGDEVDPSVRRPTGGLAWEEIRNLPLHSRNFMDLAALLPGVVPGPNRGTVAISGGLPYSNQILIDGKLAQDPLFGGSTLFIPEDRIHQVDVTTADLGAEVGRTTGGIVRIVTRSGSNEFHGSGRWTSSDPDWGSQRTPSVDGQDLQTTYNGLLGGPIVKDRVFFFGDYGRDRQSRAQRLNQTNQIFEQTDRTAAYSFKLNAPITQASSLNAIVLRDELDTRRLSASNAIDGSSAIDATQVTNLFDLRGAHTFKNPFSVTASHSSGTHSLDGRGGRASDPASSPMLDQTASTLFANPFGDGRTPEKRKLRVTNVRAAFFASGPAGRHDFIATYTNTRSERTQSVQLSPTGLVFVTPFGLDATGRPFPRWTPGQTVVLRLADRPPFKGTNNSNGFGIEDRWSLGSGVSVKVGVRYDRFETAAGTADSSSAGKAAPRVGFAWDPLSDGRTVIRGGYGIYYDSCHTSLCDGGQLGPQYLQARYNGSAGEGFAFGPGYNVANYQPIAPLDEAATTRTASKTPLVGVREWQVGYTGRFNRFFLDAAFIGRKTTELPEDIVPVGSTPVSLFGATRSFDTIGVEGRSDAWRQYTAAQVDAKYQRGMASLGIFYTYQFRNEGNYEGVRAGSAAVTSAVGDYPEAYTEDRHYLTRNLPGFQKHRLFSWATFDLSDSLSMSLAFHARSGFAYTHQARVPLTSQQIPRIIAARYQSISTGQTIFFPGDPGGFYESAKSLDAAVRWHRRLWGGEFELRGEAFNLFDKQALTSFNTDVVPNATPVDTWGLPTTFTRGPQYGRANDASSYQVPRTFQLSAAFRF